MKKKKTVEEITLENINDMAQGAANIIEAVRIINEGT